MRHSITLLELILVIVILIVLGSVGYCLYVVSDMQIKSAIIQQWRENEQWKSNVTQVINWNIQRGKLEVAGTPIDKQSQDGGKR